MFSNLKELATKQASKLSAAINELESPLKVSSEKDEDLLNVALQGKTPTELQLWIKRLTDKLKTEQDYAKLYREENEILKSKLLSSSSPPSVQNDTPPATTPSSSGNDTTSSVQRDLTAKTEEHEKLVKKTKELYDRYKMLQQELKDSKKELEDERNAVATLKMEVARFKPTATVVAAAGDDGVGRSMDDTATLDHEVEETRHELNQLEKSLKHDGGSTITADNDEAARLRSQLADLQSQFESVQKSLEISNFSLADMSSRVMSVEAENDTLRQEMKQTLNAIRADANKFEETEQALNSAQRALAALEAELVDANAALATAQNNNVASQSVGTNEQITEMTAKIEKLLAENAALKETTTTTTSTNDHALQVENDEMRKAMELAQERASRAEEAAQLHAQQLEKVLQDTRAQSNTMMEQYTSLQAKQQEVLTQANEEQRNMHAQLQSALDRIHELESVHTTTNQQSIAHVQELELAVRTANEARDRIHSELETSKQAYQQSSQRVQELEVALATATTTQQNDTQLQSALDRIHELESVHTTTHQQSITRVQELELAIKTANEARDRIHSELETSKQAYQQSSQRVQELEMALATATTATQQNDAQLQFNLTTTQESLQQATKRIEQLQLERDEAIRLANEATLKELSETRAALKDHALRLSEAQTKTQNVENVLSTTQNELALSNKEKARLEQVTMDMDESLAIVRAEKDAAMTRIAQLDTAKRELELELANVGSSVLRAKEEKATIEAELRHVTATCDQLKTSNGEIVRMKEDKIVLEKECETLKAGKAAAESACEQLKTAMKVLEIEAGRVNEMTQRVQTAQQEVQAAHVETSSFQRQLKEMEGTLSKQANDLDTLRERSHAALIKANEELAKAKEIARVQSDAQAKQIAELQDMMQAQAGTGQEVTQLRADLAAGEVEQARLGNELLVMQHERDNLLLQSQQADKLREELDEVRGERDVLRGEIVQVKTEMMNRKMRAEKLLAEQHDKMTRVEERAGRIQQEAEREISRITEEYLAVKRSMETSNGRHDDHGGPEQVITTTPIVITEDSSNALYLRNVLVAFMTNADPKERGAMVPAIAQLMGFDTRDVEKVQTFLREEENNPLKRIVGGLTGKTVVVKGSSTTSSSAQQ